MSVRHRLLSHSQTGMPLRRDAARGFGRVAATVLLAGAVFSDATANSRSSPASTEREVDVVSPDGVTLKATVYPGRSNAPGILLLPMCDIVGAAGWAPLAAALSRSGYHVMALSYRGTGGSGGARFQNAGLAANMEYWRTHWIPDAEAAIAELRRQPGLHPNRMAVGGASCGMFLALHLARRNPTGFEAVLALAGPIDAETKAFVAEPGAPPVLGLASEDDGPAPAWVREVVGGSKHPLSRAVVYQGAGHGTEMLARQASVVPLIVGWVTRALRVE